MTTFNSTDFDAAHATVPTGKNPESQPAKRECLSMKEVEAAVERTRIRTVVGIVVGVVFVSFLLAVILEGWKLAALVTTGFTLTALLFGIPFWIATIDAQCDAAVARVTNQKHH